MFRRLKEVSFVNAEEFYSKLYFVFNVSIGLSLLPFVFIFLDVLHKDISAIITGIGRLVLIAVALILVSGTYYWGHLRFKAGMKTALETNGLHSKMSAYYSTNVDKFIWFSISSLLSVLSLVLTRSTLFIVTYLFTLGSLSIYRPTFKGLIKKLRLEGSDKQVLLDNENLS